MPLTPALLDRSEKACELCSFDENLCAHLVGPTEDAPSENIAVLCQSCQNYIQDPTLQDTTMKEQSDHWQCLATSMWSQIPAVQVLAWRQLKRFSHESWAQDLLDMMYLDDSLLAWANAGLNAAKLSEEIETAPTLDSNGATLAEGDTVTLIKDLQVKGAGFTAKRGTMVRGIHLTDNPEHIEGRVSGQQIVLVSAYLKKVV